MTVKPQQLELVTETIRVMEDRRVTALELQELGGVCAGLLVSAFVGGFTGMVVRSIAGEALGEKKKILEPLLPASIPGDDLKRIADKYGWWAARLAEAVCPHNDVACVEREARRLIDARGRG